MTKIGTVIDGKYEILKVIGHGGMSIVYLAMDSRLNKQWAVKEIQKKGIAKNDEIIVNSLLAEANLMKGLDHPALPRIVDIIENQETIYVVMDYIEGQSLDKVLKEFGAQPEELVISWAKQACDALDYLHNQRPPIIYRDMKPANLMLKPEGNIKIIDFGIAREYKEQNLADTTVLGTKGYAPPEQYLGQTDPRSDIFALGMTMHHLLTGIDPRTVESYAPARAWNPEISEGIDLIIDKCVQPSPENRYQNCQELLYDLEHPNLITKGYKRKQKVRVIRFGVSAVTGVLCIGLGFGMNLYATSLNNRDYEFLISPSSATSLESKIQSYTQAIPIYPGRTEAYENILQAYEDEGKFGNAENNTFLALYNQNIEELDSSRTDVAQLNYKAGLMYFNYYTNDDGTYSFSARVQKALPFFTENYEHSEELAGFENLSLSNSYYQICSFYKKFILNSVSVTEVSKKDYEELFETLKQALGDVKEAGAYDQLTLYNGIFMLLNDQRITAAQVGVKEDEMLDLLDQVYQKASSLSVQKEQSRKLQTEMTENYQKYREAIERAYENTAERSQG